MFATFDSQFISSEQNYSLSEFTELKILHVGKTVDEVPLKEISLVCFSEAMRELHLAIEKTVEVVEESAIDEKAWFTCKSAVNQLTSQDESPFALDGTELRVHGQLGQYRVDLVTGATHRKMSGTQVDQRIFLDRATIPLEHPVLSDLKSKSEMFARHVAIAILLADDDSISQAIVIDQLR